ncbi:MAG: tetratricopeptide repeat protein [Desulfatibacillum sp.]|nr:tetratricopeptide repeat protein [Desulfatibacillum sp.]
MNRNEPWKILTVLAILVFNLSGCGLQNQYPQTALDTPKHHAITGNTFLQAGKLNDALREFQRARELDPEYALAYLGLGVLASLDHDCPGGLAMLQKARGYARDKNEEAEVNLGFIRVYAACQETLDANWLPLAEKEFELASQIVPKSTALTYYMGLAYKNACDFSSARQLFSQVRDHSQDRVFNAKAKQDLALLKKIEQAGPVTLPGRKIALLPSVTRAELSVLLMREMGADRLVPPQFTAASAIDVSGHKFQNDMEAVIALGVDGLKPNQDHAFRPDDVVTRCQFATIMKDILRKSFGEKFLGTQATGGHSPFPDVSDNAVCLEALALAIELGILEPIDRKTKSIVPAGPITGVNALWGIRVAERQLKG